MLDREIRELTHAIKAQTAAIADLVETLRGTMAERSAPPEFRTTVVQKPAASQGG